MDKPRPKSLAKEKAEGMPSEKPDKTAAMNPLTSILPKEETSPDGQHGFSPINEMRRKLDSLDIQEIQSHHTTYANPECCEKRHS